MSVLSTIGAPQRMTMALVAVLATTGGVFAWQTDFGRAFSPDKLVPAPRAATDPAKALPIFSLPPIDPQYKETIERPLFVPTRRQSPPGNAAPAQAMKKGQYKLAGTVVNADASTVFLVEQSTNKTHRVALGAEIAGIKIDRITATSVLLKQGDETEELSLRTSTSPKPPPPTAVAAAGQPGQPAPPGQPGGPGQPAPGAPFPVTPGQYMLQPGMAAGAAPGSPGGPPLPAGVPGIAGGPQTSGGFPMNSPVTGQPIGTVPPQGTNPQTAPNQAVDPNSPAFRRRRFQNLPQ